MIRAMTDVAVKTLSWNYGTVDVFVTRYIDNSLALAITEEYGQNVISTNLGGYGMTPGENCVFIKDYSEHEGLTDAIVEAGIATVVRPVAIGFGSGYEVHLNFDAETLFPVAV